MLPRKVENLFRHIDARSFQFDGSGTRAEPVAPDGPGLGRPESISGEFGGDHKLVHSHCKSTLVLSAEEKQHANVCSHLVIAAAAGWAWHGLLSDWR